MFNKIANVFMPPSVDSIVGPLKKMVSELDWHRAGQLEAAAMHRQGSDFHLEKASLAEGEAAKAAGIRKRISELLSS